jgi:phage terminase large subunit GpA-like protein
MIWEPKEELSISAWAEKYVVLSSRSEEKGPFRMRRVPYLAPILNEVLNPHTERIVVCKPAQIATAPLPCPVNDKDNVLDESGDYLF